MSLRFLFLTAVLLNLLSSYGYAMEGDSFYPKDDESKSINIKNKNIEGHKDILKYIDRNQWKHIFKNTIAYVYMDEGSAGKNRTIKNLRVACKTFKEIVDSMDLLSLVPPAQLLGSIGDINILNNSNIKRFKIPNGIQLQTLGYYLLNFPAHSESIDFQKNNIKGMIVPKNLNNVKEVLFTKGDLKEIGDSFPKLEKLSFYEENYKSKPFFNRGSSFPNVKELTFMGILDPDFLSSSVSLEGFSHVFPNVKKVHWMGWNISLSDLQYFPETLQSLHMIGSCINFEDETNFKIQFPKIKELSMTDNNKTAFSNSTEIKTLKPLSFIFPELQRVDLSDSILSAKELKNLPTSVSFIDLRGTGITKQESFEYLTHLKIKRINY